MRDQIEQGRGGQVVGGRGENVFGDGIGGVRFAGCGVVRVDVAGGIVDAGVGQVLGDRFTDDVSGYRGGDVRGWEPECVREIVLSFGQRDADLPQPLGTCDLLGRPVELLGEFVAPGGELLECLFVGEQRVLDGGCAGGRIDLLPQRSDHGGRKVCFVQQPLKWVASTVGAGGLGADASGAGGGVLDFGVGVVGVGVGGVGGDLIEHCGGGQGRGGNSQQSGEPRGSVHQLVGCADVRIARVPGCQRGDEGFGGGDRCVVEDEVGGGVVLGALLQSGYE